MAMPFDAMQSLKQQLFIDIQKEVSKGLGVNQGAGFVTHMENRLRSRAQETLSQLQDVELYAKAREGIDRLLEDEYTTPDEAHADAISLIVTLAQLYGGKEQVQISAFQFVVERLYEGEGLIFKDLEILRELRTVIDELQLKKFNPAGYTVKKVKTDAHTGRIEMEVEIVPAMPIEQIQVQFTIGNPQMDVPDKNGNLIPATVRKGMLSRVCNKVMERVTETLDPSRNCYGTVTRDNLEAYRNAYLNMPVDGGE